MPKKIKVRYDDKLSFEKLYKAFYRSRKGKTNKKEIVLFEQNLESNLIFIYDDLFYLNYKPSKYREFVIYEPKERIIKSLPIRDRVIHQWYVEEFLKPYIVPKFISDSYACIIDKGTHKAFLNLKKYMRIMKNTFGSYYIIKCDIKKYFLNIDREILYNILCKNFKDKKLLYLSKIIIGNLKEKGLPIGNYTSQYFANIYLNELDYFIKFNLKIKYYCRYMDDFICLVKDRNEAKKIFLFIKIFLNKKLKLDLNKKSRYYPSRFGCSFCGFVIFEDFTLLRKNNKKKFIKKINLWNNLYLSQKLDLKKFSLSFSSFLGHMKWANCYKFLRKNIKLLFFDD